MSTPPAVDEAYPTLNGEQWARLQAYGIPQETQAGSMLFRAGDSSYDLILVDSGEVDVVRGETSDAPEAIVARHGPGRFVGELSLLAAPGR
jgi:thioredoxin reductase (NADPH)